MIKNLQGVIGSVKFDNESSVSYSDTSHVELEPDEENLYFLLFSQETESPVVVREPLQKSLRKFVDEGLLEKNYHTFVRLCHQATKNGFDSVKKDGLHVINNEGDASLICAETKPEWKVICTLDRGTIAKFYKYKNFSYMNIDNNLSGTGTVTVSGGGGSNITTKNSTHTFVKK